MNNPLLCKVFGTTGVTWSQANWKWSDCRDCWKWSDTGVLWMGANWYWSACLDSVQPTPPIPPAPVISVVQPPGVDATTLIQPWLIEPWNPYRAGEKKKKLIRLICKVKGMEYDESKAVKDLNVSIDDIRLVINKTKSIELDMKLEE